jgi:AcrR family transcriptional regulator
MKILDPVQFGIRKNTILQHARHLFATKGFAETSMDDIAQSCSMQKASLYHYFSSKQRLLQDLVDQECSRWDSMLSHFEGGQTLSDTLMRIATGILEDLRDPARQEFFKIIHFESHKNPSIMKALKESPTHNRSGFFAVFAKHLDGRLSRNRIAIFITQFMGALLHYVSISRLQRENMCYEDIKDSDYTEQLVTTFTCGIQNELDNPSVG